jgi:hypothetical protein
VTSLPVRAPASPISAGFTPFLAGSAYLESDLEAIFDGELYPEFLLIWQLGHVSWAEKRAGPDPLPADLLA